MIKKETKSFRMFSEISNVPEISINSFSEFSSISILSKKSVSFNEIVSKEFDFTFSSVTVFSTFSYFLRTPISVVFCISKSV